MQLILGNTRLLSWPLHRILHIFTCEAQQYQEHNLVFVRNRLTGTGRVNRIKHNVTVKGG